MKLNGRRGITPSGYYGLDRPAPNLSPEQLEEEVAQIIERQLDSVTRRLAAEVDRWAIFTPPPDDQFLAALRRASLAEVRAGFVAYRLDRRLPAAPPAETADLARRAAGAGIPLPALLSVYMVALDVYWDVIHATLVDLRAALDTYDAVLRAATRYLHSYMAQLSTFAAREYNDERERRMHRQALRRLATVRDVLADSEPTSSVLGYDLSGEHIAFVATGATAEEALVPLRELPDACSLTVADSEMVWAWMTGPARRLDELTDAIIATASTSVRIGIGRRQRGPDGFRVTHRQAQSAQQIAATIGRAVIRHEEFALSALANADPVAARVFIEDELGPLQLDPRRTERLLETLEAYLDSGLNGTCTAARLGTSQRSVSHRLRLIEEALGRSIASRAPELHCALRLRRLRQAAADSRRATGAA